MMEEKIIAYKGMDKDMELQLDLLATMQKTYALLYQDGGVCRIGDEYVQLTDDAYRAAFPDATEEKPYTDMFHMMETEYNGVKFMALVMEGNDVQMH